MQLPPAAPQEYPADRDAGEQRREPAKMPGDAPGPVDQPSNEKVHGCSWCALSAQLGERTGQSGALLPERRTGVRIIALFSAPRAMRNSEPGSPVSSIDGRPSAADAGAPITRLFESMRPDLVRFAHWRSEEHTSELQSQSNLVCRLLLEKKKHNPKGACETKLTSCACVAVLSAD